MPDQSKYFDTLKTIGATILLAVLAAAAEIVASFLPQLREILVSFIPAYILPFVNPILVSAFTALQVWLLSIAKKQHKEAVTNALLTPPPSDPDDIKGLYK